MANKAEEDFEDDSWFNEALFDAELSPFGVRQCKNSETNSKLA